MFCEICKGLLFSKGLMLPNILITHMAFHAAPSLSFSQCDSPNWTLVPRVKVQILVVTKPQKCLYSYENIDCRQALLCLGGHVINFVLAPCRSCLLLWLFPTNPTSNKIKTYLQVISYYVPSIRDNVSHPCLKSQEKTRRQHKVL